MAAKYPAEASVCIPAKRDSTMATAVSAPAAHIQGTLYFRIIWLNRMDASSLRYAPTYYSRLPPKIQPPFVIFLPGGRFFAKGGHSGVAIGPEVRYNEMDYRCRPQIAFHGIRRNAGIK